MKLIAKISINYFILTALVLVLGGVVAFLFIKSEVDEEIDHLLSIERNFVHQITDVSELMSHDFSSGDQIEIIPDIPGMHTESLKDTLISGNGQHSQIAFRQLRFVHTIGDSTFLITVRKPKFDSDGISEGMLPGMAVVGIGVLLVLMITNYVSSKRIWRPFQKTVNKIAHYDITKIEKLNLPAAKTDEFNQLNAALNEMSDRVQRDYLNLKEFSENASHEMRTPLSVIRSKADLLFQSEKLDGELTRHLEAIDNAATKLARLNQALLLLAKIENRQFASDEAVNLLQVIENQLDAVEELAQMKSLEVERKLGAVRPLEMSQVLAETLVQNLIVNAVKFTPKQGVIRVESDDTSVTVANSGSPFERVPDQLFERFVKENQSADSLGLGLAIVKRICENYDFQPTYAYSDGFHIFRIQF